jgi:hypothetical protein
LEDTTVNNTEKLDKIDSMLNNLTRRLARAESEDAAARADAIEAAKAKRARKEREQLATVSAENVDFQARCDGVLSKYGVAAPPAIAGETSIQYRRRLLDHVRARLPSQHQLYRMPLDDLDEEALPVFADSIISAAEAAVFDRASVPPGALLPRDISDPVTGMKVTGFVGESYIKSMPKPSRKLIRLIDPTSGRVLIGPPVPKLGLN